MEPVQSDLFSGRTRPSEWFDITLKTDGQLEAVLAEMTGKGWRWHSITWRTPTQGHKITGTRPVGSSDIPNTLPTPPRRQATKKPR